MPLHGVRVLDLSQLLAGPYCTMMLADMGADVIKVEPPTGDPQRTAMKMRPEDEGPAYMAINRNKRGLKIDLSKPDGRDLLLDLAASCDVLIENYRPGTTTKLGIDYDTVSERHPSLIYATITGFGDDGPYAHWPGLDLIAQGMSGLMSITGHPGSEPAKIGVPITDITAGMYCAFAILTAYVGRQSSGQGEHLSVSLFSAGLSLGLWESMQYWTTGEIPQPIGSAHRLAAPYQALRTEDGYITVGAGTDKLWERFVTTIERRDLLTDERFVTNADRVANRATLQAELEHTLSAAPTSVWVDKLVAAGMPAGPIFNYGQVLEDPHTLASGMVTECDHPTAGSVKMLGTPFRMTTPIPKPSPAPLLGQHTDEVLAELGIDEARIASLHDDGII